MVSRRQEKPQPGQSVNLSKSPAMAGLFVYKNTLGFSLFRAQHKSLLEFCFALGPAGLRKSLHKLKPAYFWVLYSDDMVVG